MKKQLVFWSFALCIILLLCTSCLQNKTSDPVSTASSAEKTSGSDTSASSGTTSADTTRQDNEALFNQYLKGENILLGKTFENPIIRKGSSGSYYPELNRADLPAGILNTLRDDFDGDGQDEMLVVRFGSHYENQYTENIITLSVLENGNGVVTETPKLTVARDILHCPFSYTNVFIKKIGGSILIGCENYSDGEPITSGIGWHAEALTYTNGSLTSKCSVDYGGSEITSNEKADRIQKLKAAGFLVTDILSSKIIDQDSETSLVCSVKANFNADYDDVDAFLENNGTLPPVIITIN